MSKARRSRLGRAPFPGARRGLATVWSHRADGALAEPRPGQTASMTLVPVLPVVVAGVPILLLAHPRATAGGGLWSVVKRARRLTMAGMPPLGRTPVGGGA